jgi:hypothetical protein
MACEDRSQAYLQILHETFLHVKFTGMAVVRIADVMSDNY